MHLGHRWFLNVADGPARAADGLPWDMLHRWAVRLGDAEAARHAAAFASPRTGFDGRGLAGCCMPCSPPPNQVAAERRFEGSERHQLRPGWGTYLPSVQIMVARQTPGSISGLTLAAKGGHNGEHHNHRDVGSVVVAVDGVPLLVDAGQPTYTAQTFGPDRYDIRAMQSAWHSVPAPFGLEQGTGTGFAATVLQEPTPEEPTLALGLGAAYGLATLSNGSARPCSNREQGTVVIDDRWNLPPAPEGAAGEGTPDVDITYLVAGTVRLGNDATATVMPDGIPAVGRRQGRAPALEAGYRRRPRGRMAPRRSAAARRLGPETDPPAVPHARRNPRLRRIHPYRGGND